MINILIFLNKMTELVFIIATEIPKLFQKQIIMIMNNVRIPKST
jgi:hypothetical protein